MCCVASAGATVPPGSLSARALADKPPVARQDAPIAFVGATLIPISGEELWRGTLIVHRGKITAVGRLDDVPKTPVVLLEAAIAAANGLTFEQTLAGLTIDAARILGIDDRVGSIEVGKDGDIALFEGDPFEYTAHCIGVVIDGQVVSERPR